MANNIRIKRSAVPGKVPTTTDLDLGELAVNTYDGKLFLKKDDGTQTVVSLGQTGFTGSIGFTGSVGFTGSQGTTGFTGSAGPVAGSANQIIYRNSSNVVTGSDNLQYDGVSIKVNGNLESTYSNGDEGGEIFLNKPQTNNTLAAGITIDVYQNKLRIFENGGTNRGAFIDFTAAGTGVASDLLAANTGFTGSVGFVGSRGDVGFTGSAGTNGTTGFTGSAGTNGTTGFTGSQGIQGVTGFTGSAGTNGTTGFTGSQGIIGFTGSQGIIGFTGSLGFVGSSGSLNPWSRKTANYTAVIDDRLIADTSGGTFTITLPTTPSTGNYVQIADGADWSSTNLIIARNGSTIEGLTEDLTVDVKGAILELVYDGTTWEVFASIGVGTSRNLPTSTSITGSAGGTITPSSNFDQYNITALGATCSFAAPSGTPTDGQKLSIRIYSAAAQTITSWASGSGGYRAVGTTLPTISAVGKIIYIGCVYNSADSIWDVVAVATQA